MRLSLGSAVIFCLAIASAVLVALIPHREPEGITFWTFATVLRDAYIEPIAHWNEEHPPESRVSMTMLHPNAIEHRMISGFLSGTPVADLVETHEGMYPKIYNGPLDQIGFLDITDRLHEEGLYEQYDRTVLLQHSHRGRHFGLPLTASPAMLSYRFDLAEAAGISDEDMAQIETWDDYFRVMRPLMTDLDGDGRPDRYLLSLGEVSHDTIRMLVLQNDGVLFDEGGSPSFANEQNARTLATLTTWITGPKRVATDVHLNSATGHKQQLEGLVVGTIITNNLLGIWKRENPLLSGKIKFIPIPAFEPGGRRTSTTGSTLISINRRSSHIETSWEMAKNLYTSLGVVEYLYRVAGVITPYKAYWEAPFYHEPDPFCGGQRTGTLFIEQIPHMPQSPASPYQNLVYAELVNAMIALRAYADQNGIYEVEPLAAEAFRLLKKSQDALQKLVDRNVFISES
ncbi:hypothetical protein AXK12_00530 [Cephaloticoccus capnophilus]|uniref:ABC transporter substrate-binding protein n=1 Tax=Cephaloticoccus capnophilus TaxID=1548208 RepID=A0A139SIX7_9BACT|nr:extracellular solute-binding protein [Cephaloticoccus capnophilus]KXU34430.1 hypothetical protein AXK12_00530 [Cephaloticoccus capnophilus]